MKKWWQFWKKETPNIQVRSEKTSQDESRWTIRQTVDGRFKYFCLEKRAHLYNPEDAMIYNMEVAKGIAKKMVEQGENYVAVPLPDAIKEYKRGTKSIDPLLRSLISNNEPEFLEGLTVACQSANEGHYFAVDAMREAIKIRSGKEYVTFYQPGIIITKGLDNRPFMAREKILELAKRNALLEDVEFSGDMITAFSTSYSDNELVKLLDEVYKAGGPSEGYAFQLLKNELKYSAKFNS